MDNPDRPVERVDDLDVFATPDPDWYFENVLARNGPASESARGAEPLPAASWQGWWRAQWVGVDARVMAGMQGFVVACDVVRAAGVSDPEVRRLVRSGQWLRPARGMIAPFALSASTRDDRDECALMRRRQHALAAAAAGRARPLQVVSGRSAAILHGLPTYSVPRRPELNAAPDTTAGRHGAALVRSGALTSGEVTSWHGIPVTTVARTLADLGRHDARDAIMAADAALREELVTPRELRRTLDRARGWPGVRRSREVLALADPRPESPLESLVRLAAHDSRLPEFVPQVEIGPYRVDLLLEKAKLIIEADGRRKNSEDERWREKRRDLYLGRRGYTVERVTWRDVADDWPATVARLWAVIRASSPVRPDPWARIG